MFKNILLNAFKGSKQRKFNTDKGNRAYKKVLMVNTTLTAILNDNTIISRSEASKEFYDTIVNCTDEDELLLLLLPAKYNSGNNRLDPDVEAERKVEQRKLDKVARDNFHELRQLEDFVIEGNTVYLKGIHRSLPSLLVKHFVKIIARCSSEKRDFRKDKEFISLKRFFMWACLNPRAEVADNLYDFLQQNTMKLTSQGFFVALRNVVSIKDTDAKLIDFISNAYTKIKAVWKRDPKDYVILEGTRKDYHFALAKDYDKTPPVGMELIGPLDILYKNLPEERGNRYTDDRTKSFDIRVGRRVQMNPEDCDWSTVDCGSGGLHGTLDEINYVGCGDTSVMMLVNPMKVVGIGSTKFRCWEYFPIMTVRRVEATRILHDKDFDTLELDEVYAAGEIDSLEEKVALGTVIEEKKHSFELPELYHETAEVAITELIDIKKELSGRIVEVV